MSKNDKPKRKKSRWIKKNRKTKKRGEKKLASLPEYINTLTSVNWSSLLPDELNTWRIRENLYSC